MWNHSFVIEEFVLSPGCAISKEVLEEYVRLTDLSYVDIIEAHKNMTEVLSSIQPANEYQKFLEEFRWVTCAEENIPGFSFRFFIC